MKRPKTKVTSIKEIQRSWHLVDLNNQILGRIATKISQLLIGKNKPYFTPNLDCGDWVVAINAKKIKVTGKKIDNKMYRRHTGFPGGFRERTFKEMMTKSPVRIIELAVNGMLPKNKLRPLRLRRLKVYADHRHPYQDKFEKKDN